MKPVDGDHVLSAQGATMHFFVSGNTARATFDTFTWREDLDMWVADHVPVTIRWIDPTHIQGSTGVPPNQIGYSGTST